MVEQPTPSTKTSRRHPITQEALERYLQIFLETRKEFLELAQGS